MDLTLKTTKVFTKNYDALNDSKWRYIINQGGSRSSKTWSLCQALIVYLIKNPNKKVSIVRKSYPALRDSVIKDLFDILKELNLYHENNHKKVEKFYEFENGSILEYFSIDDAQKVRGRKRDILFANEANELSFEDFTQLKMRTTDKLIFDFNPSDDDHWLYDIVADNKSLLIKSTYKDNPFLSKSQVEDIENLIKYDENYYRIYALGLPSSSGHTIYNHQKRYVEEPTYYDRELIGVDFGYQHPTAVISVKFKEDMVFAKELIYESHLTSNDLITKLKSLDIGNKDLICDGARPEVIEDLRRAGFSCIVADKSIKAGIDAVKSSHLFYHYESQNLHKEFKNYKWRIVNGKAIDEPVKLYDDGLDALRYAVLHNKKTYSKSGGFDFAAF